MNGARGTHRFMLESEEIKRRMDALRTLRGLRQSDLAELVHGDGFGLHDVGRVERGTLPLTPGLRRSLAYHLDVDERWFIDDDVTALVKPAGQGDEASAPVSDSGAVEAFIDLREIALQNQRLLLAIASGTDLIDESAAVQARRDLEPMLQRIEAAAAQGRRASQPGHAARRRAKG